MGQGGWGALWILRMLVPLQFLGGLVVLIAWVVVQLTYSVVLLLQHPVVYEMCLTLIVLASSFNLRFRRSLAP